MPSLPRTVGVLRLLLPLAAACALFVAPAQAVVNGDDAANGEFPWQAYVKLSEGECSGVIVARDRVATAAHCTEGMRASDMSVGFGSVEFAGLTGVPVRDIANHPDADLGSGAPRWDVALLQVDPGTFPQEAVLPLATDGSDDDIWAVDDDLTVSGWGLVEAPKTETNPDGLIFHDTLRAAVVDRWDDGIGPEGCGAAWTFDFVADDMMCALSVVVDNPDPDPAAPYEPDTVRDSCAGDSGGPLVAPLDPPAAADRTDAADWRLVGLVSFGSELCDNAELPGVYARVPVEKIRSFIADPAPDFLPRATASPQLTGTPEAGQTLTCVNGTWAHPADFTFQFLRSGSLVASGTTYVLGEADKGRTITCRVIAANRSGTALAVSNGLAVPVDPPPPAAPEPEPIPAPPVVPPPPPIVPPAVDTLAPTASVRGRVCRRRVCTISVLATDRGTAGVSTVVVTLTRQSGRRTIRYRVRVRRLSSGDFELRTPKLPAARYRLTVRAIDRANNRQRVATRSVFRIRAAR